MAPTASTTSNRRRKLRIASRISKNNHSKLNDAPEEHRVRTSHNRVEKHDGDDNEWDGINDLDHPVSKGEVLEMARKGIKALERENNELQRENLELQGSLRQLKGPASDDTVSSSDLERPFNFNKCVQ
ncbi:hypothetical protein FOMG_19008 [Fusarium oxysporum f. sp. melonis 26406]|uniref:Uncharacterized protein n=1 Tax=Fusarium oxysporum f. sp. melonis 26406 TaxID=1089452 RepID=W9ZT30_FUSOX|nr:hypothetical protein FOMG_19008 [Fusarium oxysporum f. sp. melonis 26406]